jgi:HD-GYP domain-containing protein (c-di-GMP phosphodiesterase class II)
VMTNDQPYRQALPLELAMAEIEAKTGTHFDPALAPAFLQMLEEFERADGATAWSPADGAAAAGAVREGAGRS